MNTIENDNRGMSSSWPACPGCGEPSDPWGDHRRDAHAGVVQSQRITDFEVRGLMLDAEAAGR